MEMIINSQDMNYVVSKTKLDNLKKALLDCKVEYMITRHEGVVVHINAWVGEEIC